MKNKKYDSIAVDFDGTLCACGLYPYKLKIYWIHRLVAKWLKKHQKRGTILILNTLRDKNNELDNGVALFYAIQFCNNHHDLKFNFWNENIKKETEKHGYARKISATRYIDDRNVGLIGSVLRHYNKKYQKKVKKSLDFNEKMN